MNLSLGKLELDGKCHVMGILNITPDSFYDGGWHFDSDDARKRIEEMIEEGAEIIDIGGESTRPGSRPVSIEEELERVIPAIEFITDISDIPISIDTQKAEVARKAVEAGACVVNDVGGLRNLEMVRAVAEMKVPVIIMHMQGTPENMQKDPHYDDTVLDIRNWLEERIKAAETAGIRRSDVIVDPGLGFGKNLRHKPRDSGWIGSIQGDWRVGSCWGPAGNHSSAF
jgi:dihydropteroate synthase